LIAYVNLCFLAAEIDTGAMMMKNTRWMRNFWGEAQRVFMDVEQMDEVSCVAPASAVTSACRTFEGHITLVRDGKVAQLALGEYALGAFLNTRFPLSSIVPLAADCSVVRVLL